MWKGDLVVAPTRPTTRSRATSSASTATGERSAALRRGRRAARRRRPRQPHRPAHARGPQRHRQASPRASTSTAPAPTATSPQQPDRRHRPTARGVSARRQRHRPQLRPQEQHHRRLRPARPQRLLGRRRTTASSSRTAGTSRSRARHGHLAAVPDQRQPGARQLHRLQAGRLLRRRPSPTGTCFPGCETNDNGQGVNVIDGANRTIVDGNWINGLRSGMQVSAPTVAPATSSATTTSASRRTATPRRSTATASGCTWNTKTTRSRNNDDREHRPGGHRHSTSAACLRQPDLAEHDSATSATPGIDMCPVRQVNVNGTQPDGADHAVHYPVITSGHDQRRLGHRAERTRSSRSSARATTRPLRPGRVPTSAPRSRTAPARGRSRSPCRPATIVTATSSVGNPLNTSEFAQNVAVPGGVPDVHGATFSSFDGLRRQRPERHPGRHGAGLGLARSDDGIAGRPRRQPRHTPPGPADGADDRRVHLLDRERRQRAAPALEQRRPGRARCRSPASTSGRRRRPSTRTPSR